MLYDSSFKTNVITSMTESRKDAKEQRS